MGMGWDARAPRHFLRMDRPKGGNVEWERKISRWKFLFLFYFFIKKLFIWLHWVFAAACGIFSYGTWDLTPQPGIESILLDNQESSYKYVF